MNTFLLIILFVAISFFDYRHMVKTKDKKALAIYTTILVFAFVITQLHILGIKIIGLNQIVSFIINLFI
ncbi:hypothetical protein U5N28_12910 [Lysinibacillus telephonicus]|uniref:Uncharacterized protein n=1 Tax=Lysinibacillus telephonicus TaxID=1714840 RepID=A0A431UUZ8_9BACI|nr:hypothetical protein [Lysinibacillus telephonicus]RTQ94507.1 hypothetical protein EKG35_05690 [Lysinibacillus telephonicus]